MDQSQEEDPSPGIVKAIIQVISSEARKTSSVGIVARWVTTLVSVNLERRMMARAVQIVFQRRQNCLICAFESKMESWVLNSGASFHATSHMDLFENYISGNFGKVYLGDDQACDITGKGDMKIQLNGSVWKLDNVRHIPNLRKNLISIGQLASDGYVMTFTGDKWKISNGVMTIA